MKASKIEQVNDKWAGGGGMVGKGVGAFEKYVR